MPSLRNFISRLAEPELLRGLLQRHGLETDCEVEQAGATPLSKAIEDAIDSAARGTRGHLMADIERVEKLATEPGEVAIDSATVHENLADLPSSHARALYVFLHDEDGFRRAEEIIYSDSRRLGRDWTPFGGKEGLDPAADPAAIEAFKEALRGHFDTPNVHVEIFERSRLGFPDDDESDGRTPLTQITVYREDRPNTELAFLEGGDLGTQVRRRVLEAALTYEPATGIIECVGSHRESCAEMARLMATTLLKSAPEFEPVALRLYDLNPLRHRIKFDRDPDDGIEDVDLSPANSSR